MIEKPLRADTLSQVDLPEYRNPGLSVDDRLSDLLKRMTGGGRSRPATMPMATKTGDAVRSEREAGFLNVHMLKARRYRLGVKNG
ncbi:MAG: hypothetical protein NTZ35_20500 [Ignavibacteriales bacterium]|nr:hypothetical protein [Ignavibacteriales bacterium]